MSSHTKPHFLDHPLHKCCVICDCAMKHDQNVASAVSVPAGSAPWSIRCLKNTSVTRPVHQCS